MTGLQFSLLKFIVVLEASYTIAILRQGLAGVAEAIHVTVRVRPVPLHANDLQISSKLSRV